MTDSLVCALPDRSAIADIRSTRTRNTIREILHTARTIAIVGLSSNVLRPSNFVGYLPAATRVSGHAGQSEREGGLGEPALRAACRTCLSRSTWSTSSAPPPPCPAIAEEAVQIGAKALWLQFGVISGQGARDRRGGRSESGHGPLHEGRARPPHGPHALARLQHRRRRLDALASIPPAAASPT